jgi:hypothetical protein
MTQLNSVPAALLLRRIYPWLGKAVHSRWSRSRALYQQEGGDLLIELQRYQGRMPPELALKLEGYLGRLHKEWFPPTWRRNPTYGEVVNDFRWWLSVAERWREAPAKKTSTRAASGKPKRPKEPLSKQPTQLLRMLALPPNCTQKRFMRVWRQFLKENHPDLNPEQTADERRRFAEAVSLWRR